VADTSKFLILDGHSLAYRAFHGLPVENFATSSGQHTNAVYGFVSMLVNVLKDQQPSHLVVAFDISRQTFRSERYPDYKATRAKSPPEFEGQVELIKQVLESLNIAVVTADGFEADDILATLAKSCDFPVSIVSGDRDSFQLIDERVTILYPRKGMSDLVNMTPDAVFEKYGVTPKQYRSLAALVGESSDNLPGVPGVGPKTAAKWIAEFGELEKIIAVADSIGGKVGEALRAHLEQVQLNYELNRLVEDAPVDRAIENYAKRDYDASVVHATLDALEFSALRPRLFAAWPSGKPPRPETSAETKASATPKTKSSGATAKSSVADPASSSSSSDSESEGFNVVTKKVSEVELGKWLTAQKASVAVAVSGNWGSGSGLVDAIALVNSAGESVWCTPSEGGDTLSQWLASSAEKILHDAKGPMLAFNAMGTPLNSVVFDTAIASYLVSPGGRNFELSDLAMRYLGKTLDAESSGASAQLSLDSSLEISGDYLAKAARATLDLSEFLKLELQSRGGQSLFDQVEMPLVPLLAEMESYGIAVDVKALKKLENSFDADAAQAVKQAHDSVGHEFNLGSPKQLQEVLFEERGLPKTKKIKTGYTTDAESLLGLLAKFPDDELLTALLRYREVIKLKQTVTGLLATVHDDDRIHTSFNQMVAATGRLSSTEPNLQNIPIRTNEGFAIRGTFVVGKDYETLLTADYSQIELRVMAHLSNDPGLIAALKTGEDLHTTVGSQVFGVPPEKVDADMRRQIKAMSYGLAYGLSAYGLAQQLSIGNDQAKSLMNTYFERFGGVRDYLANVVVEARKLGYTESIMGRRRYLPDLNSDNRQLRDMAERMALNAPIQGSAADLVKVAMLQVDAALKAAGVKSRLLLQVHDELVIEIAKGELEQVTELVVENMRSVGELSVPMEVSTGIGTSWASAGH
jgi:DNA polymerase-1